MGIALNAIKAILLHLATKYAAELLFDFLVTTLAKVAKKTHTEFDDDLVTKVVAEREVILKIIKES